MQAGKQVIELLVGKYRSVLTDYFPHVRYEVTALGLQQFIQITGAVRGCDSDAPTICFQYDAAAPAKALQRRLTRHEDIVTWPEEIGKIE